MYDRSQFRRGLDVYDRDNNKIGDVSDVGPNYLHLSTGFLGLGQDLYIPFSAIERVDDRGAHLNVSKNEMSTRDWSRPPTEAAAAGTAAAGTTAAATQPPASTMGGTMPSSTAAPAGATVTPEEVRGHNLCDINGKQIGSISGVGAGYFHVVTGLLGLGQDLYVPIDSVDHCTRSCCYVNMTIDEMKSRGWTNRPAAGTTTAAAGGTAAARPTTEAVGRPGPVTPEGPHGVYRIPLREEEIDIHRHREQVGEVIVTKEIVEEQRTVNVPVSHEEVRIERHRVTGGEESGPITDESASQTVRVPVYEERIDVEKHPHVVEEVVVSPEETTRQERVTETVRREVPRVRTTGGAGEFVEGEENLEGKGENLEGRASVERTAEEIRREQQQQQRRAGE